MIPYTLERRTDTGVTNVTMGIWLFLASEVMLFGALFSAYALLRVAAPTWPDGATVLGVGMAGTNTIVLALMTWTAWRARAAAASERRAWLVGSTVLALAFLALKGAEYQAEIAGGLLPSASTFLAMYFTLTALHAVHVAAGAAANVWVWAGIHRVDDRLTDGRVRAVSLYWAFVDLVWLVILVLFYLT